MLLEKEDLKQITEQAILVGIACVIVYYAGGCEPNHKSVYYEKPASIYQTK